jgi:hypothetical protein
MKISLMSHISSWMSSPNNTTGDESAASIHDQYDLHLEHHQDTFHFLHFDTDLPFLYFPCDQQPSIPDEKSNYDVDVEETNAVEPASRDCRKDDCSIRHPRDPPEEILSVDPSTTFRRPTCRIFESMHAGGRVEEGFGGMAPALQWLLPICVEPIGLTRLLSRCEDDMGLLVEVRYLHHIFSCHGLDIHLMISPTLVVTCYVAPLAGAGQLLGSGPKRVRGAAAGGDGRQRRRSVLPRGAAHPSLVLSSSVPASIGQWHHATGRSSSCTHPTCPPCSESARAT